MYNMCMIICDLLHPFLPPFTPPISDNYHSVLCIYELSIFVCFFVFSYRKQNNDVGNYS